MPATPRKSTYRPEDDVGLGALIWLALGRDLEADFNLVVPPPEPADPEDAAEAREQIVTPSGSTLGELMGLLSQGTPELKLTGRAVYAAVNQSYAKMDRVLQAGDVVAVSACFRRSNAD